MTKHIMLYGGGRAAGKTYCGPRVKDASYPETLSNAERISTFSEGRVEKVRGNKGEVTEGRRAYEVEKQDTGKWRMTRRYRNLDSSQHDAAKRIFIPARDDSPDDTGRWKAMGQMAAEKKMGKPWFISFLRTHGAKPGTPYYELAMAAFESNALATVGDASTKEELIARAKKVYEAALKRANDPSARAEAKEDYDHTVNQINATKDSEGEWGVRYRQANAKGEIQTKEKILPSLHQRAAFVARLMEADGFIEVVAWLDPKTKDAKWVANDALVLKHTETNGNATVKCYWNSEWEEFVCRLFVNGKENVNASYHTNDLEDAKATAKEMARGAKTSDARVKDADLGPKKEFSGYANRKSWYNTVWGAFPRIERHMDNDQVEAMWVKGEMVAFWSKTDNKGYVHIHAPGSNSLQAKDSRTGDDAADLTARHVGNFMFQVDDPDAGMFILLKAKTSAEAIEKAKKEPLTSWRKKTTGDMGELLTTGDVVINRAGEKATIEGVRKIGGETHYKVRGQWLISSVFGSSTERSALWRRYLPKADDRRTVRVEKR